QRDTLIFSFGHDREKIDTQEHVTVDYFSLSCHWVEYFEDVSLWVTVRYSVNYVLPFVCQLLPASLALVSKQHSVAAHNLDTFHSPVVDSSMVSALCLYSFQREASPHEDPSGVSQQTLGKGHHHLPSAQT